MPTTITGTTGVSKVQPAATQDNMPIFGCRAWVNFDGTRDSTGATSTANTARFIRASGNVTSVVRNGTGDYTVNFTTAMPDANYASVTASSTTAGSSARSLYRVNGGSTTTSCRFDNASASAMEDPAEASVAIFR